HVGGNRERRPAGRRRRDRRDARARDRARRQPPSRTDPQRVSGPGAASLQAARMIRVLVADDQAAVRDGFAALIDAQDNMLAAGQAANGREAVDLARRSFPHVVLMDVRMPVLDGLQATRLICEDPTLEHTRVLVLTTFDLDEYRSEE